MRVGPSTARDFPEGPPSATFFTVAMSPTLAASNSCLVFAALLPKKAPPPLPCSPTLPMSSSPCLVTVLIHPSCVRLCAA